MTAPLGIGRNYHAVVEQRIFYYVLLYLIYIYMTDAAFYKSSSLFCVTTEVCRCTNN